ncbi:hypothetical protein BDV96DRAFT_596327 [Lophiotrema nucula]|uniref:MARVEL domain-containing protein n=1 Tax=Lophiotrema nucula TaxID=690887 RepID=A0A6A5ZJ37_9PLEO|nr:hypothetical protein BDV96DRAFT_596327 [Lophiotrema nucula]
MARNHSTPTEESDTGLLTRFVPARLKHGALYRWFLRFTRVLQFLSAIISLGIFSSRVYKVYRLVNSIKTRRGINGSLGAVEGILAAAALYTLIAMLLAFLKKNSSPGAARWLRWLWVVLDLAFVGAFIAVSVLTRPNGGPAGPHHCYSRSNLQGNGNNNAATGNTANSDPTCDLPWGTFILAIISTLLHAITAAFHEGREHHKRNKGIPLEEEKAMRQDRRYDGDNSYAGNGHTTHNGATSYEGNGHTMHNGDTLYEGNRRM